MCGIYCSVSGNDEGSDPIIEPEVEELLRNRGPDAESKVHTKNCLFVGNVLWQQGTKTCPQPVECGDIILLFNGDIFSNTDKSTEMADTAWLAKSISGLKNDVDMRDFFRSLCGPFSVIIFNKRTRNLYFGRDSLGRNSLIIERYGNQLRILSTSYFSEKHQNKVMELPPLGVYKLSVPTLTECTIFPWSLVNSEQWEQQAKQFERTLDIKISTGEAINPDWLNVQNVTKGSFNFYELCSGPFDSIYEEILKNSALLQELDEFSFHLNNSVKERIETTPKFCKDCVRRAQDCKHSKIAILYSGGIDCSILAILADKFVDKKHSIDLLNVAFEQTGKNSWDVPDRISARSSFEELQQLCPSRNWNFIEINVTRSELNDALQNRIKHLIYPLNTVLDESIGSAFWFAARGKGIRGQSDYESPARVIIVGSGADELFGGYMRHRNAYHRCQGNESEKQLNVLAELEKDWYRIPWRNLSRDDRVIADSGRTSRSPFIEESLVRYVRSLKPYQRCCYLLNEGVGDKFFLRLYGYQLGLRAAVLLKKRAIQFGSKIANKKQNAADVSTHLQFLQT